MAKKHRKRCSASLAIKAKQNHSEIPLHTHEGGCNQKGQISQVLVKMGEAVTLQLLAGMSNGATTLGLAALQKAKHRPIPYDSSYTPRYTANRKENMLTQKLVRECSQPCYS